MLSSWTNVAGLFARFLPDFLFAPHLSSLLPTSLPRSPSLPHIYSTFRTYTKILYNIRYPTNTHISLSVLSVFSTSTILVTVITNRYDAAH